ncbi:MAG: transglutaminase domain-containing protein, partial [Oscillospiraceae bacterium]|nr:transglutaminase domain-containing protein [Oscillospiraceae bacterium]
MNNCLKKAVTAATAAVMLVSAVSLDFVRPLQAADPVRKAQRLAPLPAQALEFTSADAGEAGLEQLDAALTSESSSEIRAVCDTLSALLESELAAQNVMEEPSDDPVVEARRQQYRNEITVKAARTVSALDALRAGTADETDLETIRDAFAERTASHRSDATPSIAADIPAAETEEGGLTAAAAQTPATDLPTDAETLLTGETALPQAVTDLARELGSAKEIYRYVKEKIGYEAYAGSKKGAAVTLDQLGGNDIDQARLLIAMLRTINVPARFVTGTVEITAEQAAAITGAADAESAGRILEARHKGVKGVTDQGKLVGYRMEQTWVEAYVPYTDYRGAGAAKGRSVWVPLDASFKTLNTEKHTIPIEAGEDTQALREQMDLLAAEQPLIYSDYEQLGDTADVYLRTIEPVSDFYLPASLPYTVLSVSGRYAALPDEMKDSLEIAVNGETLFSAPLTDLYFKQITVSYIPASDADRKLLDSDSKLTEVPAYLVQMLPVVTVRGDNGTDRYVGKQAAALGAMQQMTTTLNNEGDTTILTDDIFSGSVYAFNLDYQRIMPADINYSYGLLCAAKENAKEDNYTNPEILGATLDYAGKSYFAYCDEESLKYETVFN